MKWLALVFLTGCAPTVITNGVLNLHQLEPRLWRSGEPTQDGWTWLKSQHVCAVIQLDYDEERPRGVSPPDGILVFKFSMPPNDADDVERGPSAQQLLDVAAAAHSLLATLPSECIVLWHCQHGWDRTSIVSSTYRYKFQGWSKDAAYAEAKRMGFHWWLWRGLVRAWKGVP